MKTLSKRVFWFYDGLTWVKAKLFISFFISNIFCTSFAYETRKKWAKKETWSQPNYRKKYKATL